MSRFTDRVARFAAAVLVAVAVSPAQAGSQFPGIGRAATPAEIKAWDIDVRPDFKGLPAGAGSVQAGQAVWESKCASCHGIFGESNEVFAPLVGGTTAEDLKTGRAKALVTGDTARTTLMKLSTISTLWDYVHRAMPWNAPKSLGIDEVYAVVAYLLHLGDILPADFVLSDRNIAEVQARLPNRNGMSRDHGLWDVRGKPDVKNAACMKDCPVESRIASALPDHAKGAHGNLADQHRDVGPVRGATTSAAVAERKPPLAVVELAKRKACLSCHGLDKAVVGPGLRQIAARYKGQAGIEARLLDKLRRGGAGTWGPMAMPPNPDLPEADARALIAWILDGAPSP